MEPIADAASPPAERRFSVQLDALDLAQALESTGRYRRDTRLGGILHGRKTSLREVAPEDSVHLVMHGNRLHAHVDRYSPLNCEGHRRWQYSLPAVVVHNLADVVADGFRALIGRRRDNCEFSCERVWVEEGDRATVVVETTSTESEGPAAAAE